MAQEIERRGLTVRAKIMFGCSAALVIGGAFDILLQLPLHDAYGMLAAGMLWLAWGLYETTKPVPPKV